MKQLLYTSMLLSMVFAACSTKEIKDPYHFTLKGKIKGSKNDTLYLEQIKFGYNTRIDTAITNENGEFGFSGKIKELAAYNLFTPFDEDVSFPLDTCTNGFISFAKDSIFESLRLNGFVDNDLLERYYKDKSKIKKFELNEKIMNNQFLNFDSIKNEIEMKLLDKLRGNEEEVDKSKAMKVFRSGFLVQLFDEFYQKFEDLNSEHNGNEDTTIFYDGVAYHSTEDFIRKVKAGYDSSFVKIIDYLNYNPFTRKENEINFDVGKGVNNVSHDISVLNTILYLSTKNEKNSYLSELKENVQKLEDIIEKDSKVKDFSLLDDKENEFKLNTIKTEYVILYFWTSDISCTSVQFKHIKQFVSQYADYDLSVITISLDKKKADWIAALEKYDLGKYINLIDTKGPDGSMVAKAYDANIILPHFVLLYKNKIIAKDFSFFSIKEKLKENEKNIKAEKMKQNNKM